PRRSADIPRFKLSDVNTATTQGLMILAGGVLFITALMGGGGLRSFLRRFSIMLVIPASMLLWGGQQLDTIKENPALLQSVTITLNDKVIKEGPLVDGIRDTMSNTLGRAGSDIVEVSQVAIIIAIVVFGLSLLPTPGSGRENDT